MSVTAAQPHLQRLVDPAIYLICSSFWRRGSTLRGGGDDHGELLYLFSFSYTENIFMHHHIIKIHHLKGI